MQKRRSNVFSKACKLLLVMMMALAMVPDNVLLTHAQDTAPANDVEESVYAKFVSIDDQGDGNVTITLDKAIKKSNTVGWTYVEEDGAYLLKASNVADGEYYHDIVVVDSDGDTTHHCVYKDANNQWRIVGEYRYNVGTSKPTLTLNGEEQTYVVDGTETLPTITVEETVYGTPVVVVEGLDLSSVCVRLTSNGIGEENQWYRSSTGDITGDHTRVEVPLISSQTGKAKTGSYLIQASSYANGGTRMATFVIKSISDEKPVDKTALNAAINDAYLKLASTSQLSYDDGVEQLDTLYEEAKLLAADSTAKQAECDEMVEQLNAAILYLKQHESVPEILDVIKHENGTLTFELNCHPYSITSQATSAKWTYDYDEETGKHTMSATGISSSEQYFRIFFDSRWDMSFEGVRYWVYIDENGDITYDVIPHISELDAPSVTLQAGEDSYVLEPSTDASDALTIQAAPDAEIKALVEGLDLSSVYLQKRKDNGNYSYLVTADITGNHQSVTMDVAKDGVLEEGTYRVYVVNPTTSNAGGGTMRNYYYFNVEIIKADKTALQSLYDEVKDYTSDDSRYADFTTAKDNAKLVLDDEAATQAEVDKAYNTLNQRYWLSKVNTYVSKYRNFPFTEYYAGSTLSLVAVQVEARGHINTSYPASSLKALYERYVEAEKELQPLPQTPQSLMAGPSEDMINTSEYRGSFTFTETVENGKLMLHITYTNDGINDITGENLGKFSSYDFTHDFRLYVNRTEFDGSGYSSVPYGTQIEPLEGESDFAKGFQLTVEAKPGIYSVKMTCDREDTQSYGYYYTQRDPYAPQAVVTTSNEGKATKDPVTVTITANEEIQAVDGWTLSDDGMTLTKVFDENTSGTVVIKDLAGNESEIAYEVSGIDKQAPTISGVQDGMTYDQVQNVVISDEALSEVRVYEDGVLTQTITSFDENSVRITANANKEYHIVAIDQAGNQSEVRFTIAVKEQGSDQPQKPGDEGDQPGTSNGEGDTSDTAAANTTGMFAALAGISAVAWMTLKKRKEEDA